MDIQTDNSSSQEMVLMEYQLKLSRLTLVSLVKKLPATQTKELARSGITLMSSRKDSFTPTRFHNA